MLSVWNTAVEWHGALNECVGEDVGCNVVGAMCELYLIDAMFDFASPP